MKYVLLIFLVLMGAIAGTKNAYAQQENLMPTMAEPENFTVVEPVTDVPNQAVNLITEAATINNKWQNVIIQPNNSLLPTNNRITRIEEQGCQKVNPLDFLKDPAAAFAKCQQPNNNPTPRHSSEPIEYLKVPKLDSGLSVTVTQF
ncbi:hypothetical protein NIES37_21380 [Tolypothrix tenuis PCC 7101]|uniref:Uncharacterized protein n=1 Tax=Tolypothrix tenuis PCC 7101 TaxID=231146 RepID=A0A1Z4MXN9_9CYAN|nr:hypothetical protein [Aulosira sp. FACHB-113]BAY98190.1 hypothetical protein NIES37_21380 [Tolypothrix tenuis PCC 7101]BAZ77891.1 hypothetical protein NIES50_65240 [Aulosira laxa NIES-50]